MIDMLSPLSFKNIEVHLILAIICTKRGKYVDMCLSNYSRSLTWFVSFKIAIGSFKWFYVVSGDFTWFQVVPSLIKYHL